MDYNILIIDDDKKEIERDKIILGKFQKLKLLSAQHGPAAKKIITNQKQIDLILLDQVFSSAEIPVDCLYYESSGVLQMHDAEADRDNLQEDMDNQGYYILKALRVSGYAGPILFVTSIESEIGKGDILGARISVLPNVDIISKEDLEHRLAPLIMEKLNIGELQTLEEEIIDLLGRLKDKTHANNKVQIKRLLEEATARRRKGLKFIEKVTDRLKEKRAVSVKDITNSIISVSEDDEFQFEPIFPDDLLRWCLSKIDTQFDVLLGREWSYEGNNGLRYAFYSKTENAKHFYLRIIHPEFTAPINLTKAANYISFPLEFDYNDPYWPGRHIIVYFEEGRDAKRLTDFLTEKYPLLPHLVQDVLEKIKDVIAQSGGHGSITIDSLYIEASGEKIFLRDSCLYACLNEKGRKALPELTLDNLLQRDIQALGSMAEYLAFGIKGAIQLKKGKSPFADFLIDCKNGTWDILNKIPEIGSTVKIFRNGPFVTSIERDFAYQLSEYLFTNNIDALVYLNTNVLLTPPIANEVDALIIRPGKIFWLDMKGRIFHADPSYRNYHLTRMKDKLDKLKGLASAMAVNSDKISAYCVLNDSLYSEVAGSLSDADKMLIRSVSNVLEEIRNANASAYDLKAFDSLFSPRYYSRNISPYEKAEAFQRQFGQNSKLVTHKDKPFDEIHCIEKPHYIRRYSLDDPDIEILNVSAYKTLLLETQKEIILSEGVHCEHLLLPDQTIIINSQNEEAAIFDGEYMNTDIRWIYKVYKKPSKEYEGPHLLSDHINSIPEVQRLSLFFHYLEAIKTILNRKSGMDRNSLKVYRKGNEYFGVFDPVWDRKIQKDDVFMAITALNDKNNCLSEFIGIVEEASDVSSSVSILLQNLSTKLEQKQDLRELKESIQALDRRISKRKDNATKHFDYNKKKQPYNQGNINLSSSSAGAIPTKTSTVELTNKEEPMPTVTIYDYKKKDESTTGEDQGLEIPEAQNQQKLPSVNTGSDQTQVDKKDVKDSAMNRDAEKALAKIQVCRLYVGNLSYKATEDDLRDCLKNYAEVVSIKLIKDSITGRLKGFGFVEIETSEDIDALISKVNGITFMERKLIADKAK